VRNGGNCGAALALFLSVLLAACGHSSARVPLSEEPAACEVHEPQRLKPEVVATIPHQTDAYTEGLLIHNGMLFESIGLYGQSALRSVNLETGEVLGQANLADTVFGEGLADGLNGELVQLTWKEGIAYRWDAQSLENLSTATPSGTFSYAGQGWGLTRMGTKDFVMTDGSADIRLRDPQDFSVLGLHHVTRSNGPTIGLNELEWDGTSVWASRYQTDEILQIKPGCWTVTAVVDLSALHEDAAQEASRAGTKIDVANGIAKVPGADTFLVTGKLWPSIYEVRFVPKSSEKGS